MLAFDDALPGFGVRVTAGGARTFLFQYRAGTAVRRMVLGRFGELTATTARKLAEVARGRVAEGGDPVAERRDAQAVRLAGEAEARRKKRADALTVEALVARWAELGLQDRTAKHRIEVQRAVKVCFPRLLSRPADQVLPAEAQRAVDALAVATPGMARRARDYIRAGYNWGLRRRLVSSNPFAGVVIEARERSRDRVLTDAELGEVWRAARTLGWPFGPFVRVLILTLQRRGEVAGMEWSELSPDLATWTIPAAKAKNRRLHVVHLAEPVRAILRELPRFKDCTLVFTSMTEPKGKATKPLPGQVKRRTRTAAVPLQDFGSATRRLKAAIAKERAEAAQEHGLAADAEPALDWVLHDFRRTGVSGLAALGHAPHVLDRILNHVTGTIRGVAAVYQRHDFAAERKAALEAWAALASNESKGPARDRHSRPR